MDLATPRSLLAGAHVSRRLSLGALDPADRAATSATMTRVQRALAAVSRWNDRVQAALFSATRLAPTFAEEPGGRRFPLQRLVSRRTTPRAGCRRPTGSTLAGLIADKRPWTVERCTPCRRQSQITRHVCVEGWSMIGKWTGTPLRRLPATRRRRHHGALCRLRMRRRLLREHGHADRAASADLHGVQVVATRSCRANTATRSRSASRPNSASRTRNGSPRST